MWAVFLCYISPTQPSATGGNVSDRVISSTSGARKWVGKGGGDGALVSPEGIQRLMKSFPVLPWNNSCLCFRYWFRGVFAAATIHLLFLWFWVLDSTFYPWLILISIIVLSSILIVVFLVLLFPVLVNRSSKDRRFLFSRREPNSSDDWPSVPNWRGIPDWRGSLLDSRRFLLRI